MGTCGGGESSVPQAFKQRPGGGAGHDLSVGATLLLVSSVWMEDWCLQRLMCWGAVGVRSGWLAQRVSGRRNADRHVQVAAERTSRPGQSFWWAVGVTACPQQDTSPTEVHEASPALRWCL